jgi:hypothetical protein
VIGKCGLRRRAALAIYRWGKAVSRPGSSTRSSCLPVNGGSGSSTDRIRDGEKTRRDGGAVRQDPTVKDAVESEQGQRHARMGGVRWPTACDSAELGDDQSSRRWHTGAALHVEGVVA